VSSRSYLSIGDVLTLLREEFPDVTISKIRFLESQGLVNPERSPSGYRKFFEPDVERLRWVLRQQREHFLPLKVIRDRLAAGDLGDIEVEPAAEPAHHNGVTVPPTAVGSGAPVGAPAARSASRTPAVGAGRTSGSAPVGGRTEAQMAQADDEAMARILADASRRAALIPESGGEHATAPAVSAERPGNGGPGNQGRSAGSAAAGGGGGSTASTAPPTPLHDRPTASPAGRPMGSGPGRPERSATPGAPASPGGSVGQSAEHRSAPGTASTASPAGGADGVHATEARHKAAAPGSPDVPARGAAAGPAKKEGPGSSNGGAPSPATPKAPAAMVSGASMTADELCAASGLSEIELAGLQSFGMIEPAMVAGIPTFDEDALTVANLAADFRKFGVEPRHLRMYRNAVDREIGLIEQVIIPLLRQRNPESRQRALDAADELGTLGQTMRATLLRAALRRHIGG
jgi:DNA-binding transcriptional MerR regulator